MSAERIAGESEESTRDRILRAALHEYSEHGHAGARVKAIAEAAGVNVQLIYHYFGSKEGLHREVRAEIFRYRTRSLRDPGSSLEEILLSFYAEFASVPEQVRVVVREALEFGATSVAEDDVVLGAERQQALRERVAHLRRLQDEGRLPPDLDVEALYIAIAGMAIYPVVFPQVVRMVTGVTPEDPGFVERYGRFLAGFGALADAAAQRSASTAP